MFAWNVAVAMSESVLNQRIELSIVTVDPAVATIPPPDAAVFPANVQLSIRVSLNEPNVKIAPPFEPAVFPENSQL
jgi:hypothetical protein